MGRHLVVGAEGAAVRPRLRMQVVAVRMVVVEAHLNMEEDNQGFSYAMQRERLLASQRRQKL